MVKSLVQRNYLLPPIKGGLNKKQIALLIQQSVKNVLEQGNVFQVVEAVAVMTEFIKGVRNNDKLIDYIREELVKHNGKFTTDAGARIELSEVGVEYDYSIEPRWVELNDAINKLLEKRKELEKRLRTIPSGKVVVDNDTGEVLSGPSVTSKSSYKITLQR